MPQALDPVMDSFSDIAQTPLRQWRGRFPDHRPMAFMNAFVPEELLHAAGFTPVLLVHRSDGTGRSKVHLPGFSCWVVRSALDQALAGEMRGWAGVLFIQTCDALQGLADLWPSAVSDLPVLFLAMPHHLAAPPARPYLHSELQRLRERLGRLAGRAVSNEALSSSIAIYNRRRSLVRQLRAAADRLEPLALYDALRAAFLMPVEQYNPLLAKLLDALPDQVSAESQKYGRELSTPGAARLIIVGSELADRALFQVLDESGARVVADMLDLGCRHFAQDVSETCDPLDALVDLLLSSGPTPTKYRPAHRRGDLLLELVRSAHADGVIFARQKLCEPHGFDYVALKTALDRSGVPHLLIELEQTPHSGQMRTRIEAFLEMIG